ncbi:MAG: hypothetical protein WKI04_17730 [Ferruginibacter sp.]
MKILPKEYVPANLFPKSRFLASLYLLILAIGFGHCKNGPPRGDPGNGGLMLPGNFEAVVVIDSLGGARHLAVNDNGDIYVKLRASYPDGSNVALRDEDNDGQADIIKKFTVYSIRSIMERRCAFIMVPVLQFIRRCIPL